MNFFYGIRNSIIDSKITIPRFQSLNDSIKNCSLYQLEISNQRWKITSLNDCEISESFYSINGNLINNENIFCLATQEEILELKKNNYSKLVDFNKHTDSTFFRANLQVSIKGGGFSSYQSEYPFSMVTKKGSILSPLSSLLDINANENIIFLKNIYEMPVHDKFKVFFVNFKTKKVLKQITVLTNCLNEINVEKDFIKPEVFLYTDKYLGVPMFCSISNMHLSLEHSHPPHEYIHGHNKFKIVSDLKKEFNEIINSKIS
jgi:hypothetical protein